MKRLLLGVLLCYAATLSAQDDLPLRWGTKRTDVQRIMKNRGYWYLMEGADGAYLFRAAHEGYGDVARVEFVGDAVEKIQVTVGTPPRRVISVFDSVSRSIKLTYGVPPCCRLVVLPPGFQMRGDDATISGFMRGEIRYAEQYVRSRFGGGTTATIEISEAPAVVVTYESPRFRSARPEARKVLPAVE